MKQTEIGLIPDDWEVKTLQDCVTFLDSKRIPIKDSDRAKMAGPYPYYGASGIIDYINRYIFDDDLILLGEDGANIVDRSSELAFVIHGKCWINNHAHVLKPYSDFDINFLANYLESLKYEQYNTGTAQPKLNREKCNLIPVLKPTLAEQHRIAKALSDVDAVINTTEKLIQKKKNIKQGAMQSLLTGKKRLPGFGDKQTDLFVPNGTHTKEVKDVSPEQIRLSAKMKQTELGEIPEDWEVKTLGEMFDMKAGGDVDKEHFSYCKSSLYKYKIFSNGLENEGIYGYTDLPKYKGNAITITGRGTVGIAMFREEDFDAVIRLLVLNSKNDNLTNNSYITEEINSCISFPNESTGVPQLTVPQIRDIVIALPSKEEQTAIANVLSSMDKEIETLNTKLEKYRNLKTAMMQQLLTGKIRLIK